MAKIKKAMQIAKSTYTVEFAFNTPKEARDNFADFLMRKLKPIAKSMEVEAKRISPVGVVLTTGSTDAWRNRRSGKLRDSISASVAKRTDGTAVLVFLEAGNDDAFYANFVELGTARSKAYPFIRPAFYAHESKLINMCKQAFAEWVNTYAF